MAIRSRINRCIKWICEPKDVSVFIAAWLFSITFITFGFMVAYYTLLINGKYLISNNPMSQMSKEAGLFIHEIHNNDCGLQLAEKFPWLKNFNDTVNEYSKFTPKSLKYLRYSSHIQAAHNTVVMHILLSGILPVSILSCVPIITSFISTYFNEDDLIFLGLFEFGQTLLSSGIMITFIFLKERKLNKTLTLTSISQKTL